MLKPENTHPGDQDANLRDSDNLETTVAGDEIAPSESASSQADAGLLEVPDNLAADFEADDAIEDPREISMTDALASGEMDGESEMQTPEMDDLDAPGSVDIEALDEDALSDTDIPRDALLDPLEP